MVSIQSSLSTRVVQPGSRKILTAILNVDAGRVLALTIARLEDTLSVVTRSVVCAADTIKRVLAQRSRTRTSGVANLEAELAATHEIMVLVDLLVVVAALVGVGREVVGVDETAEGVTALIVTMGVKLAAFIVGLHIEQCLVHSTGDLDVVGGSNEGDTCDAACRNDAPSMAGLSTPCYFNSFSISNG